MPPPVFYCAVAEVLRKLEKKQGSLKSLVFSRSDANSKKVYALASQTLKHKRVITEVIEGCQLLQSEPKLSMHLAMVMVYDLLYGKGIQCGGALKQAILRHKEELRGAARRAQEERSKTPENEEEVHLPRYVRVNLLKTTTARVIKRFRKEGYVLLTADQPSFKPCLQRTGLNSSESSRAPCDEVPVDGKSSRNYSPSWTTGRREVTSLIRHVGTCSVEGPPLDAAESGGHSLDVSRTDQASVYVAEADQQKWFFEDPDVPDLLVFPPSTKLAEHKLYQTTKIILQDKASCLPAHVLSPPPGSTVIDACAAPGNKTTHLASIMGNQGCIYAFDKSRQRFSVLQEMVSKAGASCVQTALTDFLKVCPEDYPTVQFILVDPSCSGSGITGRVDFDTQWSTTVVSRVAPDQQLQLLCTHMHTEFKHAQKHLWKYGDVVRLNQLAKFQKLVLKHALSFPSVERVVYSTCSINKKENEGVVESTLSEFGAKFELVEIMPTWRNRGLPVFREAAKCIRASPERDLTNGFFVAMFQRRASNPMTVTV